MPWGNRPQKELRIRFWEKVDISGDCWVWKASLRGGYGNIRVGTKMVASHRVAFFLIFGYWPSYILHKCDNPSCVRPHHLVEGTHLENMRDMIQKGRSNFSHPRFGKNNPAAKLSPKQVNDIKRKFAAGIKQRLIASEYGITQAHVSNLVRGKRYAAS